MNVLITGGNGYLAKSIAKTLEKSHKVESISRDNFDLRDERSTDLWFKDKKYDAVVHTAVKGGSRLHPDEADVIDGNVKMYNNLSKNSNRFKKLIHFGSGAEVYAGNTPYAISKRMISNLIEKKDNFYNLRIFAVFDENELETRFIKSNVKKYINNQSMQVHSDKQMDFFYMQDLSSLIEYYLLNGGNKNTDCCYPYKKTLMQIANFINTLGSHNVLIEASAGWLNKTPPYTGISELPIKTVGLEEGIRRVYKKLYQATTKL